MQPESFASPSDVLTGASKWPAVSTIPYSARGFAATTVSMVTGLEPSVETPASDADLAAGVNVAATAVPAVGGSVHTHSHANGVAHTNGHVPGSNGLWSMPVASTAGGGVAAAHATVMAAHLLDRGFYLRAGKRLLDIVGASVALLLNSPLLLAVAIAIKLESRGPVFYRATRIGRGGRPFTFLKLRSMVDGADRARHHVAHLNEADGPVFKISNDPRVTRVGRFLRVTSIDEIPQFINVLRGEMSLVGPRPPLPFEVAQYEPWQLHRLDVLPGITCLWQISGRSRIGFQEWMRLDLEYIKHRSFLLDLKILIRTIPAVLSRDGAY
jgi:lipopolysaccharide/colanic/teichoic acid biosynthesis glycosyltransferase